MSLGIEDCRISDRALSASTIFSDKHAAKLGRLNLAPASGNAAGWCSKTKDVNQWLQIDLGSPTTITKVATQGRQDNSEWVTSYSLSYNLAGSYWVQYNESGKKKVFRGNFDRDTIIVHHILPSFQARFVRIQPSTWHHYICMRAELYGCPIKGI